MGDELVWWLQVWLVTWVGYLGTAGHKQVRSGRASSSVKISMGAAKDARQKPCTQEAAAILPNTTQVATLDLRNQLTSHIICPVKT